MRVDEVRSSIPLNIATILIGSTILGATENDQIHFFYHFQEGRWTGATSGALRHALLIAGRPIVFATFINVSGFLALALSDLPPLREVRHRFFIGLCPRVACRFHRIAGRVMDSEPI